MQRRQFFKASAAVAAAAASATLLRPRAAGAFGETPAGSESVMLPASAQAKNVLELFLYGGLSTWETFYAVEQYGTADDPTPALRNTQLYSFYNAKKTDVLDAISACGGAPTDPITVPFATDALGVTVGLGPFLRSLIARTDVTDRMRIVVNKHELQPHEAAIPLAMSGQPLGSPNMSGLGAHVQRYFGDLTPQSSPYSYCFATNYVPTDNIRAAVATGIHPGYARPLLVRVDDTARLVQLLDRPGAGNAAQRGSRDDLVSAYLDDYAARLHFGASTDAVRAPRFDELREAAQAMGQVDALKQTLDPSLFVALIDTVCGDTHLDAPAMGLRFATHVLLHAAAPAKYACMIDTGLIVADGGGGYDTHAENSHTQARNLKNTLDELLLRINEPGENDPTKLSLDDTMIVMNMEFGRSPTAQGGHGRNHWPHGYVQVYIGGPITKDQRGIYGAIGPDGVATTWTTPAENRIACLLALGIWPFSQEAFAVGDVLNASTNEDAVTSVLKRVLGRST